MAGQLEAMVRAVLRSREGMSDDAVEEILVHFTDDAVWHNMPVEPAVGKVAIAEMLKQSTPFPESLSIEIKNIATQGTTVFVGRVDTHFGNGRRIVMPCCGVFETRDGRISVWRDYFDLRRTPSVPTR